METIGGDWCDHDCRPRDIATTPYSTNGQMRTWAFTYNAFGSLLTANGPLSGSGDTVTYTYNTSGYLATVTNEVGQVTTVSAVNGRGLPTTIVDANAGTVCTGRSGAAVR